MHVREEEAAAADLHSPTQRRQLSVAVVEPRTAYPVHYLSFADELADVYRSAVTAGRAVVAERQSLQGKGSTNAANASVVMLEERAVLASKEATKELYSSIEPLEIQQKGEDPYSDHDAFGQCLLVAVGLGSGSEIAVVAAGADGDVGVG